MKTPIENSYWIIPGKLLAGEYPGNISREDLRKRLKAFLDAGITGFLDLTEPEDNLLPYEEELKKLSSGKALRYSFPIKDFSIPRSKKLMIDLLDTIDAEIDKGEVLYIHCYGGIGRTGTAAGCYLARQLAHQESQPAAEANQPGALALEKLAALWKTCPKSKIHPASPQTGEQAAYVRNWND